MASKDPDTTQQKSESERPQQLSDLPIVVTEEDAKVIKGGPRPPPTQPNAVS